jgi:hypothetical protein
MKTDLSFRPTPMQRQLRTPSLVCLCLIPSAWACQAIGDDSPANLGRTDGLLATSPPPVAGFVQPMDTFYGRWVGVAQDPLALGAGLDGTVPPYRFPSGSTAITLELELTDGISVGALTFGQGSVPPPPTDPEIGYPENVRYADLLRYSVDGQFSGNVAFDRGALPPHEGLPYQLIRPDASPDSAVTDGLLRVTYLTTQVLADWCGLQTPYATPYGSYSCNAGAPLTDLEGDGCNMIEYPVEPECDASGNCEVEPLVNLGPADCDKAFLCDVDVPRCECTAEVCYAASEFAELSLRRIDDALVGIISGAGFLNERHALAPLGTIVFQRAP